MKLSTSALCVLFLTVTLFVGCQQEARKENAKLKRRIDELQTENDSLKSIVSAFQQTDDYYYQLGVNARKNRDYEKSNEHFEELGERFPGSKLTAEVRELVKKNNDSMAEVLYNKALEFQGTHQYGYSDECVDELISKFPKSSLVAKAKKLKQSNKKKQKEWERTQLRQGCDLELLSWSWSVTGSGSYVEAKGQVKNISGQSLRNVVVVVTWYDKNGGFITAEESLIDFNPILPNQKSPFSVFETYNPAMKTAYFEFKFLSGATIRTYYR